MPVHDGGTFLSAAVRSILSQSLNELELVAIDDNSSDNSWEQLQAYAGIDPRLKPIRSSGRGISDALNQAIAISRSEFIARMDADDISSRDRLRLQYDRMREDAKLAVLGTQAEIIDQDSRRIGNLRFPISHESCAAFSRIGAPFAHGSVMMRKAALERVGNYRRQYDGIEDVDLWLRMSRSFSIGNLEENLFEFRVHDSNSSRQWAEEHVLRMLRLRLEDAGFPHLTEGELRSVKEFFNTITSLGEKRLALFYLIGYIALMNIDNKHFDSDIDQFLFQARHENYWENQEIFAFFLTRYARMLLLSKRHRRAARVTRQIAATMPAAVIRETTRSILSGSKRQWEKYDFSFLKRISYQDHTIA